MASPGGLEVLRVFGVRGGGYYDGICDQFSVSILDENLELGGMSRLIARRDPGRPGLRGFCAS